MVGVGDGFIVLVEGRVDAFEFANDVSVGHGEVDEEDLGARRSTRCLLWLGGSCSRSLKLTGKIK